MNEKEKKEAIDAEVVEDGEKKGRWREKSLVMAGSHGSTAHRGRR